MSLVSLYEIENQAEIGSVDSTATGHQLTCSEVFSIHCNLLNKLWRLYLVLINVTGRWSVYMKTRLKLVQQTAQPLISSPKAQLRCSGKE